LVELHGGTIHAESAGEEQGATFVVRLPFRGVRGHTPPLGRRRAPGAGDGRLHVGALDGMRVLAVDDDADARELLLVALTQHGASARVVGSVADAMRALAEHPADAILSDIGMPVEDGFDLIRRVRTHESPRIARVPAIAVTAYAHADDERRVMAAGYQAHVPKPIEPAALAALLARVVATETWPRAPAP
jgi:CheY-like chemotaxis protein